jgi:hypothetical protein
MSREDKLLAMEALWDDLCRQAGAIVSPEWHESELSERDAVYRSGVDSAEDWTEAKAKIRSSLR